MPPEIRSRGQRRRILAQDDDEVQGGGASRCFMAFETVKSTPRCLRCGALLIARTSLPKNHLVCPNYPYCKSPPPLYASRQAA
jgi:hypothetical protein